MPNFIEESVESVYSQYELIDSILYDEALEAEDPVSSMANSVNRTTTAGKENTPGDNSRTTAEGNIKNSKNTQSLFARIKRFFEVIIEHINITFQDITDRYKRAAVSDKEFKAKFKKFAKLHGIRDNVTFTNGEYNEGVLETVYSQLRQFCARYNIQAKNYIVSYNNAINSNTATEQTLKDINANLINLNKSNDPAVTLANALKLDKSMVANYKAMVVAIHDKFIGKQTVVRLNATDDSRDGETKRREAEKYIQSAVNYLDRYANHYYKRLKDLTDNMLNEMKNLQSLFEKSIAVNSTKIEASTVLSKRVAELTKHNTTCINLIKYCGSCYIEKAINCRLIVQRAYGF